MKTNKKLALNKQIMANLDGQAMGEVKGGVSWTDIITYGFFKLAEYVYSHGFNDRGECLSDDLCGNGPYTGDCPDTEPGDCIW